MSITIRLSLLAGVSFYAFWVLYFLRKEKLNLKYSLVWIFFVVIMYLLILFPQLVNYISILLGIKSPVNAVFVIESLFVLLILLSLTAIVSTQMVKIRKLSQSLAILENKLDKYDRMIK